MIIKQSVVDVLMFLFERYLGEDDTVMDERDDMHHRLEEMGFEPREINQAFDWLEDLAVLQGEAELGTPCQSKSMRIFSEEEKIVLNEDCRGFLIYLEQTGILTPVTREVVLDRVIALNHELDIEQLKWIAMIILHTHPGEENAFAWMESLVFDEIVDYMQ
jgi:Smg protein